MRINILWVVIAIVAGFTLGGWGLRADLRKVKQELTALQAKAGKSEKRSAQLDGIRTMLKLPENKLSGAQPGSEHPRRHSHRSANTNAVAEVKRPDNLTSSTNTPARQHKSMSDELKQASELWNTRVALARNSLISNLELKKDQEAKFDTLVAAMNIRLGDSIGKWADYLKAKGELNPEDGIRMMNDLSTAMVLTYNDLDTTLPPGWREKAGENFQLVNFIDPEIALPLADVEGILNKAGRQNHGQGLPTPDGTAKPGVSIGINTTTK